MRITRTALLNTVGVGTAIAKLGPADGDIEVAWPAAAPQAIQAPPSTPPAHPPAPAYAIRHADGRWLTLAVQDKRVVPVWVSADAIGDAWTWTSQAAALHEVLGSTIDLLDAWTVVPIA